MPLAGIGTTIGVVAIGKCGEVGRSAKGDWDERVNGDDVLDSEERGVRSDMGDK